MTYKCAICGYEIETTEEHLVKECGWIFYFHHPICFICKNKPMNGENNV